MGTIGGCDHVRTGKTMGSTTFTFLKLSKNMKSFNKMFK